MNPRPLKSVQVLIWTELSGPILYSWSNFIFCSVFRFHFGHCFCQFLYLPQLKSRTGNYMSIVKWIDTHGIYHWRILGVAMESWPEWDLSLKAPNSIERSLSIELLRHELDDKQCSDLNIYQWFLLLKSNVSKMKKTFNFIISNKSLIYVL